jgi:hypothetical protein
MYRNYSKGDPPCWRHNSKHRVPFYKLAQNWIFSLIATIVVSYLKFEHSVCLSVRKRSSVEISNFFKFLKPCISKMSNFTVVEMECPTSLLPQTCIFDPHKILLQGSFNVIFLAPQSHLRVRFSAKLLYAFICILDIRLVNFNILNVSALIRLGHQYSLHHRIPRHVTY